MSTLYIETDAAMLLDRFQMALTGSIINNADFVCSIGNRDRSGLIAGVVAGTPHVVTSPDHGLSNGEEIIVTQVRGVSDCKGVYSVANVSTHTFELVGSSGSGAFLTEPAGTPRWYVTVPGATNLSLEYQIGSQGRYMLLLPGSLPFANRGRYVAIVDAVGFHFHREFYFSGKVWN